MHMMCIASLLRAFSNFLLNAVAPVLNSTFLEFIVMSHLNILDWILKNNNMFHFEKKEQLSNKLCFCWNYMLEKQSKKSQYMF